MRVAGLLEFELVGDIVTDKLKLAARVIELGMSREQFDEIVQRVASEVLNVSSKGDIADSSDFEQIKTFSKTEVHSAPKSKQIRSLGGSRQAKEVKNEQWQAKFFYFFSDDIATQKKQS